MSLYRQESVNNFRISDDVTMELQVLEEEKVEGSRLRKLAENLRTLLDSRNLNPNQLGQVLGIPTMTIRRILSGETTDPRISTVKTISDFFNISVDKMIDEDATTLFSKSLDVSKPVFVPILDWKSAGESNSNVNMDLTNWKEWQPLSLAEGDTIGRKAFALESRPTMYPRFPQGSILIIDPDLVPKDGDIVLIKLKKDNELTLRELKIDPPQWQLHSLVLDSNDLIFDENEHVIVGVNLLTLLYNR